MSKYGNLSRSNGNSKWFLQRTLVEHDRSMDDPWMQIIYKQGFTVRQYASWLARNWACFVALEARVSREVCPDVFDEKLHRARALEVDLQQLLGAGWREEAEREVRGSPATQKYLEHLEEDARSSNFLACHHFLQYNAVLSGGTYLGKMVSEKLSLLPGTPGVAFYAFPDVPFGKESARVQQYMRDFDKLELTDEERDEMLRVMQRIYADTEDMMREVYELNPLAGVSYEAAKEHDAVAAAEPPPPCAEPLELSLDELHVFNGKDRSRILLSICGDLLDVTAGSEIYGPGGSYSLLAGRDVTRCLATMSLEPAELDDLVWQPDGDEEAKVLKQWRAKLGEKYPVAGRLVSHGTSVAGSSGQQSPNVVPASSSTVGPTVDGDARCPISGKIGVGCPMSTFGIVKKPDAKKTAKVEERFMAGKSLVASVQDSNAAEDWWLSKLCPLHWTSETIKSVAALATFSWFHGIFIGWMLHKQLVG